MTVDIMMPFYGDQAQFRIAVESVIAQTDDDWRLTIIDDVYPDTAPGEWAASIADPRVRYIRNEENLGVAGNFQKSLDLATAEFVTIMGCDDRMRPDYVARVTQLAASEPAASYIQPGVVVIDDDGTPFLPLVDRVKAAFRFRVRTPTLFSGEELTRSLLHGNWTYFPSIAWRTEVARGIGFRADLDVTLDLALQLAIIREGGSMLLDAVPVFEYRRHAASVSSGTAVDGTRFEEEARLFAETARDASARGWRRARRAARLHVTSRLNALTRLPQAARAMDAAGVRILLRHALR